MFTKTGKRFLFIFFTVIFSMLFWEMPIFAQKLPENSGKIITSSIQTLEFDFTKKIDTQKESTIKGRIVYREAPFYFAFETFEPEPAFGCIDSTASAASNLDFSELSALIQTCNDFLLWFKDDFGLGQTGFSLEDYFMEDNRVLAKYSRSQADFIKSAELKFSDNFLADEIDFFNLEEEVISKTIIDDFAFCDGHFYPCKIRMINYDGDFEAVTTEFNFSNIKIKRSFSSEAKIETAKNDFNSGDKNSSKIADSSYSIPAVTAQAGFALYKKFITAQDASSCRYEPSCSKFMLDAIKQNGLFGIIQGIDRLERCTKHEHSRNLYPEDERGKHLDPVPVKKNKD